MTVHIGELSATVDATASPTPHAASAHPATPSVAARERLRSAAERATRIAARTRAEGFDD